MLMIELAIMYTVHIEIATFWNINQRRAGINHLKYITSYMMM